MVDEKQIMISVIVPVYNSEKYLHKCIYSVLNQSYQDFELILVNDGSTDSSGMICDEYAEKDERLRVIHKKNGGVSSARNLGLINALGKWLLFVDSDDWIDLNALERLVELVNKFPESDLIRSFHRRVLKEDDINNDIIRNEVQLYSRDRFLKTNLIGGFISSIFVKKDIVVNNDIKFQEDLIIKEDLLFTWQCLVNCDNVLVNYEQFYNACIREGSITRKESFEKVLTSLTVAEYVYKYALVKRSTEIMKATYEKYLNPQLQSFIIGLIRTSNNDSYSLSSNYVRRVLFDFLKKTNFHLNKMNFETFTLLLISFIDYRILKVLKRIANF